MDINIQATIGTCGQFQDKTDGEYTELSVVIAPLKVTTDEKTGKTQIISGCNVWRSCFNEKCWYSMVARQAKKT
jgi:hypothetical protein